MSETAAMLHEISPCPSQKALERGLIHTTHDAVAIFQSLAHPLLAERMLTSYATPVVHVGDCLS